MSGHGCAHYVRLVTSSIGVLVGILACLTFSIMYHHIEASVFAFISAVFAWVCLTLHVLHHRNVLQAWHSTDTLNDISKLGFSVFVIGLAFTVWYIFDGVYHHRAMMPVAGSPYITAVWTFMTSKWGFLLWSCSQTYSNGLLDTASLLGD